MASRKIQSSTDEGGLSPSLNNRVVGYANENIKPRKLKEKMLKQTSIWGSDILPWELKYFLNFGFESFFGQYPMVDIKDEDLLDNAFSMFFPEGFPKECMPSDMMNASIKSVVSESYKDFKESNTIMWLKKLFPKDLNNMSLENIQIMKDQLMPFLKQNYKKNRDFQEAFLLATRVADVMYYLVKDESRPKAEVEEHDKIIKHELVKGLVYQIMAFLAIPVIYNGEGRYDFKHQHIPDRTLEKPVSFKIKPDASVFMNVRSCTDRLPFGVVEVHGPFSVDVLEKVRSASEDDSVVSSPTSGSDGKIEVKMSGRGDEKKARATGTKRKDPKNLSEQMSDEMISISVSEKTNKSSDPIKISVSIQTDECSVPYAFKDAKNLSEQMSNEMMSLSLSSDPIKIQTDESPVQSHENLSGSLDSSDTSIYKNVKKKKEMNAEIKEIGPSACKDDLVFRKFYGQLPLEMYGMLINKNDWQRKRASVGPIVGMGMFVLNELVYLVKISDKSDNLPGAKGTQSSCGPTVTFAKNFWFNLKNPDHLIAFMYFMACYHQVEQAQIWATFLEVTQEILKDVGAL